MDWTALERSRNLLQRRTNWAATCPPGLFCYSCHQLLVWLRGHPIFRSILARIGHPSEEIKVELDKIGRFATGDKPSFPMSALVPAEEREGIAMFLYALDLCAKSMNQNRSIQYDTLQYLSRALVGKGGGGPSQGTDFATAIQTLRDVALIGLFNHLTEEVELGYGLLEAALRYKQRSEFFRRKRLREMATTGCEGKIGERALAIDLYEYVFDRNLEFTVEEVVGTGRPDLVLRSPNGSYGVLDAKYLADATKSSYSRALGDGFNQVASYCRDKGEYWGVLAAYLNAEPRPVLPIEQVDGLQFLMVDAIRVYFILIDICEREPASKLGKAKEIHLSRADLFDAVPE